MSLFNITWRTQVSNLLPWFKRITNVLDFLTALCEPLRTKATEWVTFDNDMRKRAKFNGQAMVLAAALNNIYGVTIAPFILVETVNNVGLTTFIYNDDEETTFFYNTTEGITSFFYNDSEIILDYDFVVSIPAGIYTVELDRQITSEVKTTYKLSGKKFITQSY